MSVKANWFVDESVGLDDGPDPFAAPIQEVGERIDLTDPQGGLQVRLIELVRREANLHNAGITCSIKASSDSCCHACPKSRAHVPQESMSVLCRLGREQEKVLTELAVIEATDSCQVEKE